MPNDKTDEYELLPHEEIEELRKAVREIKEDPIGEKKAGKTLMQGIEELNKNLKKLIHIFESAQEDLLKAYSETSPTKLLKDISDQNKKIAEGMLGLAELLKDQKKPMPQQPMGRPTRAQPQPMTPNAPRSVPPLQATTPNIYPRTQPSMPPMNKPTTTPATPPGEMPPLKEKPKKKGLFSKK